MPSKAKAYTPERKAEMEKTLEAFSKAIYTALRKLPPADRAPLYEAFFAFGDAHEGDRAWEFLEIQPIVFSIMGAIEEGSET